MKTSEFIRVALVAQVKQIADLGLWYHAYKFSVLSMSFLGKHINPFKNGMESTIMYNDYWHRKHFLELMGDRYAAASLPSEMVGTSGSIALFDGNDGADRHLQTVDGVDYIHVPTFLDDYYKAAIHIAEMAESGEIEDAEVLIVIPKK